MVCVYMPVLEACHTVAATSCWQVAGRPSPLSLLPVGTDAMQHLKHRVATPCPGADGSSQALHGVGAGHDGRGALAALRGVSGQQAHLRAVGNERQGRGHACCWLQGPTCCPHACNPCHACRCKPPRSGPPRTPPRTSSARPGCASSWPPCTASTRRSAARWALERAGADPSQAVRPSTAGVYHAACNPQHITSVQPGPQRLRSNQI